MEHKTALVTGASAGIGRALVGLLVEGGWRVVAVVRDRNRWAEAAGCEVFEADLADREASRRTWKAIASRYDRLDAVFANAGVLLPSMVFSTQGREMHFEVNVVAVHQLLRHLGPALSAGRGVVVASGSSIRRMVRGVSVDELVRPRKFVPMTGPYAASKHALAAYFAESEAAWGAQGVRLRYVDLPPTKTVMSGGLPGWMRWARFAFATPEAAARRLLEAVDRPRPLVSAPVPGLAAWLDERSGA